MSTQPHPDNFDIPNRTPEDYENYVNLLTTAIDWAHKRLGAPDYYDNEPAGDIIIISWLISDIDWWEETFNASQIEAAFSSDDRNTYWKKIIVPLSTPEVEREWSNLHPDLDREKYFSHLHSPSKSQKVTPQQAFKETSPSKEFKPRAPERVSTILPRTYVPGKQNPEPNPDLKDLSIYGLVKHYALVRKTTVFDFIFERSGNLNFANVHTFIQHNNNYKLSSRGRVVYDGSFSWISRELKISIPTVWRAFTWMAQRKLVTKIAPQDHRIKKNSRWYVCTSMAQNLKLWSMAFQDQEDRT